MTHDEGLLWLNDHCGSYVTISTMIEHGDNSAAVMTLEGILRHWTDTTSALEAVEHDDIRGLYTVGENPGATIDLTEIRGYGAGFNRVGDLTIEFYENTWLRVTVATTPTAK